MVQFFNTIFINPDNRRWGAAQNNLKAKNARQPVERKDKVRDTRTNRHYTQENRDIQSELKLPANMY